MGFPEWSVVFSEIAHGLLLVSYYIIVVFSRGVWI
jgi:hypothetical protein